MRAAATIAVLTGALGFSLQTLLLQVVCDEGSVGALFVITVRGIVQMSVCAPFVLYRAISEPASRLISWRHATFVMFRTLFVVIAVGAEYSAIIRIPLGDAAALFNSAPIWAIVLAAVLLREPLHVPEMVCVAIVITGIIVVVHPELGSHGSHHEAVLGRACALFGALSRACANVMERVLGTALPTSAMTLTFVLGVAFAVLPLALNAVLGVHASYPALQDSVLLSVAGIGLLGVLSQWCRIYGNQRERLAVTVTLASASEVILAFFWQQFVRGVPISWQSGLGASLIVGAVLCIIRHSVALNTTSVGPSHAKLLCSKPTSRPYGGMCAFALEGSKRPPEEAGFAAFDSVYGRATRARESDDGDGNDVKNSSSTSGATSPARSSHAEVDLEQLATEAPASSAVSAATKGKGFVEML